MYKNLLKKSHLNPTNYNIYRMLSFYFDLSFLLPDRQEEARAHQEQACHEEGQETPKKITAPNREL